MIIRSKFLLAASLIVVAIFLQACNRSPQLTEAAFLKKGKALVARKQYARAALEFRNAIRAAPKDAGPYYQLGIAYMQTGDVFDAFRAFSRAAHLNPKDAQAQIKLAELLNLAQQSDLLPKAAARLKAVLIASPGNEEATDALAVTELQMGNSQEATQRLEESLQTFPSRLKSSVTLARILLIENDLNGAEAALQKATTAAPDSPAAHLALGQLYVLRERPEKAEPEIARAIQLDAKNSSALLTLAVLQIHAKHMLEAEKTLRQLSSLPDKRYKDLHAVFLYLIGSGDAAVAELEGLVRGDPDNRPMRSHLVDLYLEMNRIQDAQKLLADVLKHNPKDTDALFERGQLYLKTGKPRLAELDLKEVLRFQADSARVHFALARVYAAEGLVKNERDELDRALDFDSSLLSARLALAKSFVLSDQPHEALDVLSETPASQKRTIAVIVARNWALLEAGLIPELQVSIRETLHAVRTPELLLQDGLLKMEEKDYAGARADADEVLKLKPQDSRGARLLADTYIAQNETSQAMARLSQVAAAHPNSPSVQFLIGQWHLQNNQIAPAQKAFEAALAADPNFAPAAINLAEIDRLRHNPEAARRRLQAVIAEHPGNLSAFLLLANIDEEIGDRAGEIAAYKSAIGIDSLNEYALNNLAYALAIENPDEAQSLAERAVTIDPENAAAQDTLGWIYYRKGIYGSAVDHLKTAVDRDPNPQREFHLAMSYEKAGHPEMGTELLRNALKQDPNLSTSQKGR